MARVKWLSGDSKGEEGFLGYHELQSALEAGAVEVLPDDPEKDQMVERVTAPATADDDALAKAPGGGEVVKDSAESAPEPAPRGRRKE